MLDFFKVTRSRPMFGRCFLGLLSLAVVTGFRLAPDPARAQSNPPIIMPDTWVSTPTTPLIEWSLTDTLVPPTYPVEDPANPPAVIDPPIRPEIDQEYGLGGEGAEESAGILSTIESLTMLESASLNGYYFIPADPSGAVGPNHVLSVVNSSIRWHTTGGAVQSSQRLGMNSSSSVVGSFFEPLTPINSLYDPKAIYDTQAGRFLVVVLEKGNSPTTSRILVAVSDDSDPNGTWYYLAINSKLNISGQDCWADYPSISVDEQAVYITNNMFTWPGSGTGCRLWIVDKTAFYSGAAASWAVYDPYALAGAAAFGTTSMVANVYGTPPAGSTGTWLLSYSGLTDGTNEYIGFLRVDNPIASPTFTYTQVTCGNVDNTGAAMPDASQPGTAIQLEMNDNRALAACFRNNKLYLCAQVVPSSGPDAGQATAHWWKFNATTPASITLMDQGNVGGEEIAAGTSTAFPSIAVDSSDDIAVGFSAVGATTYPGAYYAVRAAGDVAGTMQTPVAIAPGVDYYYRAFGGSRNRWGDYTVTAIDPAGTTFWAYNKYAVSRGTVLGSYPTEDGRWGSRWASFSLIAVPPALTASVSAPNGGESWAFGSAHNITWSASGGTGTITLDLDYSTNGGGAWTSITTGLANSGTYSWSVPATATAQARVRVTAHDALAASASDNSNADFTISDQSAPTVAITSPTGGENWTGGASQAITWTASDNVAVTSLKLEFSSNNGGAWSTISTGEPNDGTYSWTVPLVPTAQAKVKVTAYDLAGNSQFSQSGAFTITVVDVTPPTVAVTAPNGGQTLAMGASMAITWTASDNIGVTSVTLAWSGDNGSNYTTIASGLANSGTYSWTVPATATVQGRVRATVSDAATNSAQDASDAAFTISDQTAPVVSLTQPAAAVAWQITTSHNILWTATDNIGVTGVTLEYSSNNGGSWSTIATGLANSGTYGWTVPGPVTATAKVRATAQDLAGNSTPAVSAAFSMTAAPDVTLPTITLSAPNGGETWGVGTLHAITWSAADNIGVTAVMLEYSANNGGSWSTIASGLANSGTYNWTAPATPTALALVRATASDAAANQATDAGNAVFSLTDQTNPTVSVSAPAAGNSWTVGTVHTISWTASDNIGVASIDLDYSANNGGSWTSISTGEPNDGAYSWAVPNSVSAQARVRAIAHDAAANSATGQSGLFTIAAPPDATPPTVSVLTPNGGESWAVGSVHAVTWTASDNVAVSSVKIDYSANNGSSWTAVASGLANSGTYNWTTSGTPTAQGRIRVTATDAALNSTADASDASFTLVDQAAPTASVSAPAAGSSWTVGSGHTIVWSAADNVGVTSVDLEFSADNGANWTPISTGETNDGLYSWTVPATLTTQGRVRATAWDAAGHSGSGQSGLFTITNAPDLTPPVVTVAGPNGGEMLALGSSVNVTWTASDNVGVASISIDYSSNGGSSWTQVASGLANSGSYNWTAPTTPTAQGRIKVTATDAALNSASDASNSSFALTDQTAPVVSVSAPGAAVAWIAGSVHAIQWIATDNVNVTTVDLALSLNNGSSWSPISTGEANDGTYSWTVPATLTGQARVRATAWDTAANSGSGQSGQFSITAAPDVTPPTVTLLGPNGGETLAMGASVNVTWTAADNVGVTAITLEYSANNGGAWSTLATNEANDGGWSWSVPAAATTHGMFRATARDAAGNSTNDASNAVFTVQDQTDPTVTLLSPVGPTTWTPNGPVSITWSASDNVAVTGLDIDFSTDGGGLWQSVATNEPNDGTFGWTVPDVNTTNGAIRLIARDAAGNEATTQLGSITVQPIVPVSLVSFLAARDGGGVTLHWEVTEAAERSLFHVHRQSSEAGPRTRLTAHPLAGRLRYEFSDAGAPATAVQYWLEEIDPRGASTWYGPATVGEIGVASTFSLTPASPNPFRLQTALAYTLNEETSVRLTVHDIQGRGVVVLIDRRESAGAHVAAWDGTDATGRPVRPGVYFVSLEAGSQAATSKVVLAR